jgi:hypothetical protein
MAELPGEEKEENKNQNNGQSSFISKKNEEAFSRFMSKLSPSKPSASRSATVRNLQVIQAYGV